MTNKAAAIVLLLFVALFLYVNLMSSGDNYTGDSQTTVEAHDYKCTGNGRDMVCVEY